MARILVIDDYPAVLAVLQMALPMAGHEVSTAGNGAEGLRLALRRPPDLALIDVDMPEMDGIAVCAALRQNEATRHVPVLMITGRPGADIDDRARRAGALGVIAKPFELQALLDKIVDLPGHHAQTTLD